MFTSFKKAFNLYVTDGNAIVTMFVLDKEQSQHGGTTSASVGSAEICLMSPPRQSISDTLHWTPTANLKLLLKAASPDLHSREVLNDQCNLNNISWSKAHVAVPDVSTANDCSRHSNVDMITTDECPENVTVSVDKRRRKEKSLGSLCER